MKDEQLVLKQVKLTETISSRYLLEDISFSISSGDRLGIVGSSGAGKTSLLRLLNRLDDPTSGLIKFDSQPLNQLPIIKLRQTIVLVPQEPRLLGMTVRETLAYPLILQQLSKSQIQQRLDTWMAQLHISQDWLERNELQLSLGQRQLISIARALVMQPKLLLLDEPTSALDVGTAHHLLDVLIQLSETVETTIIMVNHHLELVQKFAEQVLYLQQGKILTNQSKNQVNWQQLKEQLIQVEANKMIQNDDF